MAKVTIRHVAEAAGVGIGTVSRVLNNNTNVSDKTREIVLDTIEELGFVPNAAARQLPRKTPFQSIGVITRPFNSYYSFAERLRGVQKALAPYLDRFDLSLYTTSNTTNYDERLISIIETSVITGLLLIDFDLTPSQKEALNQRGLPYVGLNHVMNPDGWVCFGHSNEIGGYKATEHLLDLGHKRIAYIGDELIDKDGFITSKERYTGYLRALADAGMQPQDMYFKEGELTFESGRDLALELLTLPEPPTAIFAMSDIHALGALEAARLQGVSVPEELSIIGYDDLELCGQIGLTSVRQHLERGGEIAMNYLLQMIHHEEPDDIPRLPDLEIIERRTTARL